MTVETALGLSLALFLFCFMPGPGVLAVTARSMSSGFRPAMGLAVGMTVGDLFYAVIAMVGLAAIGRLLGEFFIFVKMAGAGYLIWMGLQLWIKKPAPLAEAGTPRNTKFSRDFLVGFAVSLGNPKVVLFYLGFLPAFIDLAHLKAWDIVVVTSLVAVVICGTLALWAYAARFLVRFFTSLKAVRRLNRSAGTVLIGAGVFIASE